MQPGEATISLYKFAIFFNEETFSFDVSFSENFQNFQIFEIQFVFIFEIFEKFGIFFKSSPAENCTAPGEPLKEFTCN